MIKTSLTIAFAALLSLVPSLGTAADKARDTVTELHTKGFNTFCTALTKSDYLQKVAKEDYTVIAPTDIAFRDLPSAQLEALLSDKEKLNALIANHIVQGKVSANDLKGDNVKALSGQPIRAKNVEGKLKIGEATLVRQDIPSANGVVHGVDKLLQAP